MSKNSKKRVRPSSTNSFASILNAVSTFSDQKKAEVLDWLIDQQVVTGVLSHIDRFNHRCITCTDIPRLDSEVVNFVKCVNCKSHYCPFHINEVPLCSNKDCGEHDDVGCDDCVFAGCETCGEALCRSCWCDQEGDEVYCKECLKDHKKV